MVSAKGENARHRERERGRTREREEESQTFTTAQYWSSDIFHFQSIFVGPSSSNRLYPFHPTAGSYLTTVICISILLKKISNKVRAGGNAAATKKNATPPPPPQLRFSEPRPSEIHTFKSRSTGRTVCSAEVRTSRWTAVSFRGRS